MTIHDDCDDVTFRERIGDFAAAAKHTLQSLTYKPRRFLCEVPLNEIEQKSETSVYFKSLIVEETKFGSNLWIARIDTVVNCGPVYETEIFPAPMTSSAMLAALDQHYAAPEFDIDQEYYRSMYQLGIRSNLIPLLPRAEIGRAMIPA